MDRYHNWCNLRPGTSDVDVCDHVDRYLGPSAMLPGADDSPRRGRLAAVASTLVVLSMLALPGCGPDPIEPDQVSVALLGYGEFEIRDGQPALVAERDTIECELGKLFGVDYRIDYPEGTGGTIPIEARWIHPAIDIPRLGRSGRESSGGTSEPMAPRNESGLMGRSLWSITYPEELRSGLYVLQIRVVPGGRVLLNRAFEIAECADSVVDDASVEGAGAAPRGSEQGRGVASSPGA